MTLLQPKAMCEIVEQGLAAKGAAGWEAILKGATCAADCRQARYQRIGHWNDRTARKSGYPG